MNDLHFLPYFIWFLLLSLIFNDNNIEAIDHPEEFVNILAGTFTDGRKFSTGNTLPLVGLPWGFNHWSPQSIEAHRGMSTWWFSGNSHEFTWLRCTHQPSPWIGDWGWFIFGPQMADDEPNHNPMQFWEPRAAVLTPYVIDVILAPYQIRLELTPTMHGAYIRITYPEVSEKRKYFCFREAEWVEEKSGQTDNYNSEPNESAITPTRRIRGVSRDVHIERLVVSNFGMYIAIESDPHTVTNIVEVSDMICFHYPAETTSTTILIATSLISHEQASHNLKQELYSRPRVDPDAESRSEDNNGVSPPVSPPLLSRSSYDSVYQQAKDIWRM